MGESGESGESGRRAFRVGLTGGIGSGKSTVAARFAALGVPVIDTDQIAREVVALGTAGFREVVSAFGSDILAADGTIDRPALRQHAFASDARRARLEAILHPRIRAEMQRRAGECRAPYVIIAIPLLVETGQADEVDRVLLVDTPERLQRERAAARPGWKAADVDRILRRQAQREDRLAAADDVITNDGSLSALERQVDALHKRYLALVRDLSGAAHDPAGSDSK